MTIARNKIVNEEEVGVYLITNRCVRRAFLMGRDLQSGKMLDSRRGWIEDWLESLSKVMLVDVLDFTVLSNHYHLVLRNRPDLLSELSDEECARRLAILYPGVTCLEGLSDNACPLRATEMLSDSQFERKKTRLASISAFMAIWQEAVAKRANLEDECTGHFWEDRFHSVKLLDSIAILYALAYVDLNQIKAGMSKQLAEGNYSGIALRCKVDHQDGHLSQSWLTPFDSREFSDGCIPMSFSTYLSALTVRAENYHRNKLPNSKTVVPDEDSNSTEGDGVWSQSIESVVSSFRYMMGSAASMERQAVVDGKQWYAGISTARVMSV